MAQEFDNALSLTVLVAAVVLGAGQVVYVGSIGWEPLEAEPAVGGQGEHVAARSSKVGWVRTARFRARLLEPGIAKMPLVVAVLAVGV